MSPIIPILAYRDPRSAIEFLCTAFGFERQAVHEDPDGAVVHAELRLGDGLVMVGTANPGRDGRPAFPAGAHHVYVPVEDTDAHHARATAAGADVFEGPTDRDYGSREYGARDPEGGVWYFGTYAPARATA